MRKLIIVKRLLRIIKVLSYCILLLYPFNSYAINANLGVVVKERNYVSDPIQICVDSNFWFPYTFNHKGKSVGLHTDIVKKAFSNLNFDLQFESNSWKRCLQAAKAGSVDAILSISFLPERKLYINYPEDAGSERMSTWRISQVAYYPITSVLNKDGKVNKFYFDDQYAQLPKPIRAESGYSIVKYLRAKGLRVVEGDDTFSNFQDLLKTREGCVIAIHETAESLRKKSQFKRKIFIHRRPIYSKSYFLGFSRRTDIPKRTQRKIWREIKSVRENTKFSNNLIKKYGF